MKQKSWTLLFGAVLSTLLFTGAAGSSVAMACTDTPPVEPNQELKKLATGDDFGLVVKPDGSVWGWGSNINGVLGLGYYDGSTNVPTRVVDLVDVADISSGYLHTAVLKTDGTVWTWGVQGTHGTLGVNLPPAGFYPERSPRPVQVQIHDQTGKVQPLTDIKSVIAGGNNTFALSNEGDIWTWGQNDSGQAGVGSVTTGGSNGNTGIANPQKIVNGYSGPVPKFKLVAAGKRHSLAVAEDGSLWAWGRNNAGQFGDGGVQQSTVSSPYKVMDASAHPMLTAGVKKIVAGYDYSLLLDNHGDVWAFGTNTQYQLGGGATTDKGPRKIDTLTHVVDIVASDYHAAAIQDDGGQNTVWGWGDNGNGQLGTNDKIDKSTPVRFGTVDQAVAVAAGKNATRVLTKTGDVWTSGLRLGDGVSTSNVVPVKAIGLATNVQLDAVAASETSVQLTYSQTGAATYKIKRGDKQIYSGTATSLTDTGIEYVSGTNAYKTFGLTPDTYYIYTVETYDSTSKLLGAKTVKVKTQQAPIFPPNNVATTKVAAGLSHSLALLTNGEVWAWGTNANGQLGNTTVASGTRVPVKVQLPDTDIVSVKAGASHSLVLKSDGTVWGWGSNSYGQLAIPNVSTQNTPVQIQPTILTDVQQIAAGKLHSLALKADGSLLAWGRNTVGQLGDGTGSTSNIITPVLVNAPGITFNRIAAGGQSSIAVDTNGNLWTWGLCGMCGDNSTTELSATNSSNVPKQVMAITEPVKSIAAGENYFVAVTELGEVYTWGENDWGTLGEYRNYKTRTPHKIAGLTGVKMVSTTDNHTIAVKDDGTVWAWGQNDVGQLGDLTAVYRYTPVLVGSNLTKVVDAIAGDTHNLIVKDDGTVWSWGSNSAGQLGINESNNRYNVGSESIPLTIPTP